MMKKNIATKPISNILLLSILIAPMTILFYAVYIFNPINSGNTYLYVFQILADIIAMTQIGALWITILLDLLQSDHHRRDLPHTLDWLKKKKPTVDVFITVTNEPLSIVSHTITKARDMDYPHDTYVLDDGDSQETKALAKKLKVNYISRPQKAKGYAKAGNITYGLKHGKGEFFAIFDADHAPRKSFLSELLPFFETKKVALVQSPQHYTNLQNFIASGTSQAQEIFYKYVQPAKNSYNAAFCVGTNMLYRKSSVDEIGGIHLIDHSEDIWTTIRLHELGYESVFYNKILADGRAPEKITSYLRQQNRWAQGGFSLFFTKNPLFVPNLTADQKLQYLFSNIHYFSGFAICVYLTLPLIYLLFGIHSMSLEKPVQWMVHFIPYFITVYFLPLFLLGTLKLSTISTSIASFSSYIEAFWATVMRQKHKWVSTEGTVARKPLIMKYIWPHVFYVFLCFMAILVGWYNVQDIHTTAITTFWVFLNAYFLFSFIRHGLIAEVKN